MAQALRALCGAFGSSCRIGNSLGAKLPGPVRTESAISFSGSFVNVDFVRHGGKSHSHRRQVKINPYHILPEIPAVEKTQERLTEENAQFLQQVNADNVSPLKAPPPERKPFTYWTKRTGLICKKIGVIPQWLTNGRRIRCSVVQVIDNHVVSSSAPEEFAKQYNASRYKPKVRNVGCMVVGAESIDPTNLTDDYVKLFEPAGLQPKRKLSKFIVTPDALVQPGTALRATHFRTGDYVDVGAKTIDHGFQGVMKRWKFKGGPATHGATKFHRRPGSIGHGAHNSKVKKGKKMPGFMGGKYQMQRCLQIMRMNRTHDVMYIRGTFPGATNSWCYVFDTVARSKRPLKNPPPMPTHYPEDDVTPHSEETFVPLLFQLDKPTIEFEITEDDLKKVRTGAKTAQKSPSKAPPKAGAKVAGKS
ncbi:putative 39S ribosomal protein L3, mitochondrial [Hypsibius exemplaris]|uniref:Large ribosomal subunit protein uL3m n=1 Tax=Hypsibius exemplaris TaxID=2072580 RepID=A0A1W0X1W4_HYPEX|nr:putative 39S ribosomal protein L3, mitochondrial [Hypsibius exemplaris]